MKWLILLMLVACGKHEQPGAVDARDNDGDQITNYQETNELEKDLALVTSLKTVKGYIRFQHSKITELNFSNHFDVSSVTKKLLVARNNHDIQDEYFSEWKKLRIDKPILLDNLKLGTYTVNIHFEKTDESPDELLLIKDNQVQKLGKWAEYMKVELSAEDLSAIASGKNVLSVHKRFYHDPSYSESSDQTIIKNTHRYYYMQDQESKIMYVSKHAKTDEFLKKLNIDKYFSLNENELFFMSKEESSKQWFLREHTNGDRVLVLSTIQDIHKEFLNRFQKNISVVQRQEGRPTDSVALNNKMNSTVYLRLRAIKSSRTFFTERRIYRERTGGGGREGGASVYECKYKHTGIKEEKEILPTLNEVLENLVFTSNNSPFELHPETDLEVKVGLEENGPYWEIQLKAPFENINVSIKARDKSTYVVGGNVGCGASGKAMNDEGRFKISLETFVEKLP